MNKFLKIIPLLILSSQSYAFSVSDVTDMWRKLTWGPYLDMNEPGQCDEHYPLGLPKPTVNYKRYYLCRNGYASLYSPDIKSPEVVAYQLTPKKYSGMMTSLTSESFLADPQLDNPDRVKMSDYKDSGMIPLKMVTGAELKYDQIAIDESFFLSNTAPATPKFVMGIWASLNKRIEKWTTSKGQLYIYTGPIYAKKPVKTIGNKVPLPSHFYKIIIDPKLQENIVFIIPNEAILPLRGKVKATATYDLGRYIYNIKTVEKYVNVSFLPDLKDYPSNFKEKSMGSWALSGNETSSSGERKKPQ